MIMKEIYWMKYAAFWLLLLYNVLDSSYGENTRQNTREIVIEVKGGGPQVITSPNFPQCCTPVRYLLRKTTDDYKYWKMLFTDLDLPPYSELFIYGNQVYGSAKVPVDMARYFNRAWIYPVVLYEGYALSLEFRPPESTLKKDGMKTYVGFNATFWLDNDPWVRDKPLTVCPMITDVIHSGRIKIDSFVLPDAQHYKLSCTWHIKPVPKSDLEVYITLESLSGYNSSVKIREGLVSSGMMLYSGSNVESSYSKTFVSKSGFHIELSKPTEEGMFVMSYGVRKRLFKDPPFKCEFQVDGISFVGFTCDGDTGVICIPSENKCNRVNDCNDGKDEMPELCEHLSTVPTMVPKVFTTRAAVMADPATTANPCVRGRCADGRCPKSHNEYCLEDGCPAFQDRCHGALICVDNLFESCPDGSCGRFERRCADGTCAGIFDKCSSDCTYPEKRCNNGQCVMSYRRCPEEPCPAYQPLKCDDVCLYESSQCDGIHDCMSGIDERKCGFFQKDNGRWKKLGLLLILVIPMLCIGFYLRRRCEKANQANRRTVVRQAGDPTPNQAMRPSNYHQPNIAPTTIIYNPSGQSEPSGPSGPRTTFQPKPPPYQPPLPSYPSPPHPGYTPVPYAPPPSVAPPPYGFDPDNPNFQRAPSQPPPYSS